MASCSVQRYHKEKVIGLMVNGEIRVSEGLTTEEDQKARDQLNKATGFGFASCIVTHEGTYATKKIYP